MREERPDEELIRMMKQLDTDFSDNKVQSERELNYLRRRKKLEKLIGLVKNRQSLRPQVKDKSCNNKININPSQSSLDATGFYG